VKHAIVLELFYADAWHVVPAAQVQESATVATYRGYAEEQQVRPAELRLRIVDTPLVYDPDNPLSPLYGLLGLRTPARLQVDGEYQFAGEVASWRAGMSDDYTPGPPVRGYRYVDVVASGIIRRVAGWARTVTSTLRRELTAMPGQRGYWPCEDSTAAAGLTNVTPAGRPASTFAVSLQTASPPAGSDSLLGVGTGGVIRFPITLGAGTGFQFGLLFNLSALTLPAAPAVLTVYSQTQSFGWTWSIVANATQIGCVCTNSDGDTTFTQIRTLAESVGTLAQWVWCRVSVLYAAGTVTVNFGVTYEGATRTWSWQGSYASLTVGAPVTGLAQLPSSALGHVIVTGPQAQLLSASVLAALSGFPAEVAGDRFARICTQEGVAYRVVGTQSDTQMMGGQGVDSIMDLLKEAVITDDGLIFEDRASNALVFRTRRSMYAAPKLELSYPQHIGRPFAPVVDDLAVGTAVIVKNADGSQSTAAVAGTEAESGQERKEVRVNIYNPLLLADLAAYWLNRYTVPGARYPSVVLDLDANPQLAAAAAALDPGDLITVAGYRPDPVTLMVLGIAGSTASHRRTLTLSTVDGTLWRAGVYGVSRYDLPDSTLQLPATAAALTLTVNPGGGSDAWSSAAPPYEWMIGAERVRVSAITEPAGTPRVQVATVLRAVNGVALTHPAGQAVHIADPGRYGR
jgi:hypothetical protein